MRKRSRRLVLLFQPVDAIGCPAALEVDVAGIAQQLHPPPLPLRQPLQVGDVNATGDALRQASLQDMLDRFLEGLELVVAACAQAQSQVVRPVASSSSLCRAAAWIGLLSRTVFRSVWFMA
jgi:hypothetical protein